MNRLENVTVLLPDGMRKSLGVIFPGTLTFNTAAQEIMELVKGSCRVPSRW